MRRLIRVLVLLVGGLIIAFGGVLSVSRAVPSQCLVITDYASFATVFDVGTGIRWNYPVSIRHPVSLREVSHNGQYVAYLKRNSVGTENYTLFVDEIATGHHLFTVNDAAYTTLDGIPSYQAFWSPNDQYLAYQELSPIPTDLKIFSQDGSHVWQFYNIESGVLTWSPDSKVLAVLEFRSAPKPADDSTYIRFWTFEQNKSVAYLLSKDTVRGVYWSPTGGVLAIQTYENNAAPSYPSTLTLITPDGVVLVQTTITVEDSTSMPWSPDGHYLYFSGFLFAFDGRHLNVLTNILVGGGQWSPDSTSLTAYRRNPDQTLDQVVYYPAERRYETRLANLMKPPIFNIPHQHIDAMVRRDGSDWFVVMNMDGSTLLKLPIKSMFAHYEMSDLGSTAVAVTEYGNPSNLSSPEYITWARRDGSLTRTLNRDFYNNQTTWLNAHVLFYQEPELGQAAVHAGLIDAETGQQTLSITANFISRTYMEGGQLTIAWEDKNGIFWLDKYLADGTQLYHLHFDLADQIDLSPDGRWLVVQISKYDGIHDVGVTNAALVEVHTYRTIPLLANQMAATRFIVWKPDNSAVAIASQTWNDQPAIDVFDANGHLLRHFGNAPISDRQVIQWTSCDQVTDASEHI